MAVSTRRIVLINVTTSPTLDWVKQQIRTVTAFGEGPRYLIHDNDGIFGQFRERQAGRCYRCHFDQWYRSPCSRTQADRRGLVITVRVA